VNVIQEIKLPSRIESVEEAAASVDAFCRSRGYDDLVLFALDMATRESVANAVKHGNKFDEQKDVDIQISADDASVEIAVRDRGTGFAVSEIPDPTDPENLLKASGRGILFMQNFMDAVSWENHPEGGTVVRMSKNI
jgi:serine/threonine-protein kinase RsbW